MHERRGNLLAGFHLEWRGPGLILFKRLGPAALEIDGIDENEPRIGVYGVGRNEVFDAVGGHDADPVVDFEAGGFGGSAKIGLMDLRTVIVPGDFEIGREKMTVLLRPEAVGDVEGDLLFS